MATLAAAIIALTLMATALARTDAFHYPAYAKEPLLQSAVLLLWILWAAEAALASAARQAAVGSSRLSKRLPELTLVAFGLLAALSAVWSGIPYVAVLGALPLLFRLTWALLVADFIRRPKQVYALLLAIVLAGFLAALGTALARWSGMEIAHALAHYAGHRNFLAMFLISPLCLGGTMLTIYTFHGIRTRRRAVALAFLTLGWGGVALMLLVFTWCDSIGGWVGLAVAAGLLILWHLRQRARRLVIFAALILGMVGVAWFLTPQVQQDFRRTIVESRRYPEQATRYFILTGSWRMFRHRPLLGWGADTFLSRFPQFRPVEAMDYGVMGHLTLHPHNEVVSTAVSYGLVGTGLLFGALGLAVWRAARVIGAPESNAGPAAWMLRGLVAGTLGILAHSLFDVGLRFWAPACMFWTQVGLLLAVGRGAATVAEAPMTLTQPGSSPGVSLRFSNVILFAVTTMLGAVIWWQITWQAIISERRIAEGDALRGRGAYEAAAERYKEGIFRSRYTTDYILTHGHLGQVLTLAGHITEAIQVFRELRQIAPGLGRCDLALGQLYEAEFRRYQKSDTAYAGRALRLAAAHLQAFVHRRPDEVEARKRLALLLRTLGATYLPEATAHLRYVVTRRPGDPAGHFILAGCLLDAGEAPEAETHFAEAAQLSEARARERLDRMAPAFAAGHAPAVAALLTTVVREINAAREAWEWAATAAERANSPQIGKYRSRAATLGQQRRIE